MKMWLKLKYFMCTQNVMLASSRDDDGVLFMCIAIFFLIFQLDIDVSIDVIACKNFAKLLLLLLTIKMAQWKFQTGQIVIVYSLIIGISASLKHKLIVGLF